MKAQYKITGIQRITVGNKYRKETRFDVYELIDKAWVYQFSSSVSGHYKTDRGIQSQICRENAKWGHDAAYVI